MNTSEYIVGCVAVAVYLTCVVLHTIPKFPNKFLPLIAALLGVGFNAWFTWSFGFATFVGGLASGLGAVGIDQGKDVIVNLIKEVRKNDEDIRN